jgi:hypothetical protein
MLGFAHVKQVPDSVAAHLAPVGERRYFEFESVPFAAGELIGYTRGGPRSIAVDIFAGNTSVRHEFPNPDRRGNHDSLHGVCPFGFYPPAMFAAYDALFGTADMVMPGSGCGSPVRDVVGTAAGEWFGDLDYTRLIEESLDSDGYGYRISLAAAPDGRVSIARFSLGTIRIDPENPTHADPAMVTDSHCYQRDVFPEGKTGWVFVRVAPEPHQLHVAYSSAGECPASFPSTYRTYYR